MVGKTGFFLLELVCKLPACCKSEGQEGSCTEQGGGTTVKEGDVANGTNGSLLEVVEEVEVFSSRWELQLLGSGSCLLLVLQSAMLSFL